MKPLFFAITFLAPGVVESLAQEADPAIEDLKWGAVVTKNEAIFTFPASKRKTWSWYNAETRDDLLEYGWDVMIGDLKSGFHFGSSLYKPSDSRTASGSLLDLLNACQHDLWRVSDSRGFRVGEFGQTKLENSKVLVIVSDRKLLEQIFGSKSETVHMMITTPEFMIRQKVPIDYKK